MTAAPLTAKELLRRIKPGGGIPVDVHTTGLLVEEIRRITNVHDELVEALKNIRGTTLFKQAETMADAGEQLSRAVDRINALANTALKHATEEE